MKITESAVAKIKEVISEQDNLTLFVRVGLIMNEATNSPAFMFSLDDQKEQEDVDLEISGITVVLNSGQVDLFENVTIDYNPEKNGFSFSGVSLGGGCGSGCGCKSTATPENKVDTSTCCGSRCCSTEC